VNGESSLQIDRGHWLYHFELGVDNIAIYRARRSGQDLASPEVWRTLAPLGVSDAFVVPVPGGWQPFVEVADGRDRWALERRESTEDAATAVGYFLASLAGAVAYASHKPGAIPDKNEEEASLPAPSAAARPEEDPAIEAVLAQARSVRDAAGWELIYSRQRAVR